MRVGEPHVPAVEVIGGPLVVDAQQVKQGDRMAGNGFPAMLRSLLEAARKKASTRLLCMGFWPSGGKTDGQRFLQKLLGGEGIFCT